MDYLNPDAARQNSIRKSLVRCFEAADVAELNKIDHYLEKYQGREQVMFTKLRNKYRKFPECQN